MEKPVMLVMWEVGDVPAAEQIEDAIQAGGRFCWYYENNGSDMHCLAFFKDRVVSEEEAVEACYPILHEKDE